MRVAICYWGIARSTDFTIESIERSILQPLINAGIETTVFLHTYTVKTLYSNARAGEWNLTLKNDIWKLLLPDYFLVENQADVDRTLSFEQYRSQGDPWEQESVLGYTAYATLDNHIRALYSLYQVTQLWKPYASQFDAILYIRPDMRYITPLQVSWIQYLQKGQVLIPDFHLVDEWNDRFAIGKPSDMLVYGERYRDAKLFSQQKPLHAERFLSETMKKRGISPRHVRMRFRRIRANGVVFHSDESIKP